MFGGRGSGTLRRALFGQPALSARGLRGPSVAETLPVWAQTTWDRCHARLTALKRKATEHGGGGEVSLGDAVAALDACSLEICAVLDTVSGMSLVFDKGGAQADDVKATAEKTFLGLYSHVQQINVDHDLHLIFKSAYARHMEAGADEDELERVGRKILEESRWEGASFADPKKRAHISDLQDKVRVLESRAQKEAAALDDSNRRPLVLPGGVTLPNTHPNFATIVASGGLEDPLEQQKLFFQRYALDSASIEQFANTKHELRQARHLAAKALDYSSFAHLVATKNMVGRPKVAEDFLCEFLRELEPTVFPMLQARNYWELPKIMAELERSAYQQASRMASVNSIFTARNCLLGAQGFLKKVFDVHVEAVPIAEEEKWTDDPLCLRWEVHDGIDAVGDLYLDLFSRPGKQGGPCVMQIRTRLTDDSPCHATSRDPIENSSVALLSANFTRHAEWDTPIGHAGFRALMHEMGHAMHTLLSRTAFQHLSGSRCETDFVETPSLLFERLSWDPAVFTLCDPSGRMSPVDAAGLPRLRVGHFAALDLHHQSVLGVFDLRMHGEDSSANENQLYWDCQKEFSLMRIPENTSKARAELFFQHSIGSYAGNFYAYVWSQAIASRVYESLFAQADNLAEGGARFKRELLTKGGSRDPLKVMKSLVGSSKLDPAALVRSLQAA